MSSNTSPSSSPQNQELFYQLLEAARKKATKSKGYDSTAVRAWLTERIKAAFGWPPREWQLDIGEALALGLDIVLVAGTGAGKTLPFVMPVLLPENAEKMVLIVSPLNELQRDQAQRFRDAGISAAAVNGTTWNKELKEKILAREFRVLLTSPEQLFEKTEFHEVAHTPEVMRDVVCIIADEAHTITQWSGNAFRPLFAKLGSLRSLVDLNIPILATSATMTPDTIQSVKTILHLRSNRTLQLNLGNNRPNITPLVCPIKAGTDWEALKFVIHDAVEGQPLKRTLIYVLNRDDAQTFCLRLRECLPEGSSLRAQIDFLNAGRDVSARIKVLMDFRKRIINVLLTTEIAGMGLDLWNVYRMLQVNLTASLSESLQHKGRIGRDGKPAYAIQLVPRAYLKAAIKAALDAQKSDEATLDKDTTEGSSCPQGIDVDAPASDSVIEKDMLPAPDTASQAIVGDPTSDVESVQGAEDEPEDQDLDGDDEDLYSNVSECNAAEGAALDDEEPAPAKSAKDRKKRVIEPAMREYATTTGCRRAIVDKYFDNPPIREPLTVPCCDNCMQAQDATTLEPGEFAQELQDAIDYFNQRFEPKPKVQKPRLPPGLGARKDEKKKGITRLTDCKNALISWRLRTWKENHALSSLGYRAILPDRILETIAKRADLLTVDDLKAKAGWLNAEKNGYGLEVLAVLKPFDDQWKEERAAAAAEKAALKKVESIRKDQLRKEKRRLEGLLKTQNKRNRTSSNSAPCNIPPMSPSQAVALGPEPLPQPIASESWPGSMSGAALSGPVPSGLPSDVPAHSASMRTSSAAHTDQYYYMQMPPSQPLHAPHLDPRASYAYAYNQQTYEQQAYAAYYAHTQQQVVQTPVTPSEQNLPKPRPRPRPRPRPKPSQPFMEPLQ
ncbi:DEAD/DEAH box helicase domain-containing protein [Phanerochaete sordida]|uniref:DNA 3'-5' helicase n=1 Tax=Phanerochaete sordida TaxID=48140 RepID=A0A9P3LG96_9APHY|nr:DEAD/DEAH box helicase domain-containing protein [Phanerochaete sordida]